ncbi:serine protease [Allomyces arbusculus]|nr:serine protease [Allomyces arbusculus]
MATLPSAPPAAAPPRYRRLDTDHAVRVDSPAPALHGVAAESNEQLTSPNPLDYAVNPTLAPKAPAGPLDVIDDVAVDLVEREIEVEVTDDEELGLPEPVEDTAFPPSVEPDQPGSPPMPAPPDTRRSSLAPSPLVTPVTPTIPAVRKSPWGSPGRAPRSRTRTRTRTITATSGILLPGTVPGSLTASPAAVSADHRWKAVLERAIASVVSIRYSVPVTFDTFFAGVYTATGFVVDAERGLVLTNKHVVTDAPVLAKVAFRHSEEVEAKVVYADPVHDFGVIQFNPKELRAGGKDGDRVELRAIPLAPSEIKVGIDVKVPGADAGEKLSILSGTVARIDRPCANYGKATYCDFNTFYIQASSNTSGGSSGSPVLNDRGQAVALNAGGSTVSASSFFLPLDRVIAALDKIQHGLPVARGTLQVEFVQRTYDECRRMGLPLDLEHAFRALDPTLHGCLAVQNVFPGGPAAGRLHAGDVLVAVNGRRLAHFVALAEILDEHVGRSVEVTVLRPAFGGLISVEIPLVEDLHALGPRQFLAWNGDVIHGVSVHLARSYLHPVGGVMLVKAGHVFGVAGIPAHVMIVAVNHQRIATLDEFCAVVQKLPHGARVPVRYYALNKKNVELVKIVELDRVFDSPKLWTRDAFQWSCAELPFDGFEPPKPVEEGETPIMIPSSVGLNLKSYEPVGSAGAFTSTTADLDTHHDDDLYVPPMHTIAPSRLSPILTAVQRSLVLLEFKSGFGVDGLAITYSVGVGIVVDAARGLVVTDRMTVPTAVGRVSLCVGNCALVTARILAMDPLHNTVWVQYDPRSPVVRDLRSVPMAVQHATATAKGGKAVENDAEEEDEDDDHNPAGRAALDAMAHGSGTRQSTPACGVQLANPLAVGDDTYYVSVSRITHLAFAIPATVKVHGYHFFAEKFPPQPRTINFGHGLALDNAAALTANGTAGVLTDKAGNVQALWLGHRPCGSYLGTPMDAILPVLCALQGQIKPYPGVAERGVAVGEVPAAGPADEVGNGDRLERGFASGLEARVDPVACTSSTSPTSTDSAASAAARKCDWTLADPDTLPLPAVRTLDVELNEVHYWKARDCGLGSAWIRRIHAARPDAYAVLAVRRVASGTPTAAALREMDLVLAVDGKVVASFDDVQRLVLPGESVAGDARLLVFRDGQEVQVTVPWIDFTMHPNGATTTTTATAASRIPRAVVWAGAAFQSPPRALTLTVKRVPRGVYVAVLYTGAPAHRDGLASCVFVTHVDGRAVTDLNELLVAVEGENGKETVPRVDFRREGWMAVARERQVAKRMGWEGGSLAAIAVAEKAQVGIDGSGVDRTVRLTVVDLEGSTRVISVETCRAYFPTYVVVG